MKIGIDIVEHERFKSLDEKLVKRILSVEELTFFSGMTNKKRQIEYVASRFASKEAIFKAYQEGDKTFNYLEISILNKPNNAPYVKCDRFKDDILISISHSESYSIAMVVVN